MEFTCPIDPKQVIHGLPVVSLPLNFEGCPPIPLHFTKSCGHDSTSKLSDLILAVPMTGMRIEEINSWLDHPVIIKDGIMQ